MPACRCLSSFFTALSILEKRAYPKVHICSMDISVGRMLYYTMAVLPPVMLKMLFGDSVAMVSNTATFFELRGSTIQVQQRIYGTPKLHFLILHDNENTGKEAAEIYCGAVGGSITELCYGEVRNITYGDKKGTYSFDPNQMFESGGLYKSMQFYSDQKPSHKEIQLVRSFADSLLVCYKRLSVQCFITLHNNTEGDFNIHSYVSGKLKAVRDRVYINRTMDPDDLIFVTETVYYAYLRRAGVNVVLQSISAKDGSLSVYAQRSGIPYVNIEVQHGHWEENLRLIFVVAQMFKDLGQSTRSLTNKK
jgi:hypothetical protein